MYLQKEQPLTIVACIHLVMNMLPHQPGICFSVASHCACLYAPVLFPGCFSCTSCSPFVCMNVEDLLLYPSI